MIDFDNVISTIRDNNGFTSNANDDSYYRTYNTSKGVIQVRISNHGTHLWTWVNNAPINPSQCIANICIVFSKDGKHNSSTGVKANKFRGHDNNPDEEPYNFEVTQYVYNCSLLTMNNAFRINEMRQEIPKRGKFYDPLMTDRDKHAGVYKLMPNQPIQTLVTQSFVGVGSKEMIPQNTDGNNARPSTKRKYGADAVSESKTIRLNESDLRRIVMECIRKVLSESEHHYNVRKIGRWDCIPSNGYEFQEIPGKGTCVGIMMYVDNTSKKEIPPTYCLFRRGNNGKYFYATIIASPEGGPKATKFSIVPLRELPVEIYKDRCNLSLQV